MKRDMNNAYYKLSHSRRKYIRSIINTPNWSEKELSKMGDVMRIDIEEVLKKKRLFIELFCY